MMKLRRIKVNKKGET